MTASSFRNSRTLTVTLGIAACLVVSYIVIYPDHILESSLEGLTVWWKIVFPAMLPFLIIIEIMSALGVMHFIGTLLDPAMRRLFGLPGIAGWCLTVGWTAGSPASARHIAELRQNGQLTRPQAERLMALSHAGSPVLLIIVIAAGFLGHPELGLPLLLIHWLGAIAAASLSGIGSRSGDSPLSSKLAHHGSASSPGLLASSFIAMNEARAADGRPFGKLLGDSVFDSIQKLMVIGGYMIFFSVILKVLMLSGAGTVIVDAAGRLLGAAGIPAGISQALFNGLFEQHLGAYAVNGAMPDVWTVAVISAIMGWSGLCLHAQVKAATSGTDIRYYPFLLSRLLHAAVSAVLALMVYPLLASRMSDAPGFRLEGESISVWSPWPAEAPSDVPGFADIIRFDILLIVFATGLLITLAIISTAIDKLGRMRRKIR